MALQKGYKYLGAMKDKKRTVAIANLPKNVSGVNNPFFGKKHTEATRKKMSINGKGKNLGVKNSFYGKTHSKEVINIIRKANIGRKKALSEQIKHSNSTKGEKCYWRWKGGVTPIRHAVEMSYKAKDWRQKIYQRDNFTCQDCGDNTGGNLNAHHLKHYCVLIQEAREYLPLFDWYEACMVYDPLWNIDNGITLCKKCHIIRHKKQ